MFRKLFVSTIVTLGVSLSFSNATEYGYTVIVRNVGDAPISGRLEMTKGQDAYRQPSISVGPHQEQTIQVTVPEAGLYDLSATVPFSGSCAPKLICGVPAIPIERTAGQPYVAIHVTYEANSQPGIPTCFTETYKCLTYSFGTTTRSPINRGSGRTIE